MQKAYMYIYFKANGFFEFVEGNYRSSKNSKQSKTTFPDIYLFLNN